MNINCFVIYTMPFDIEKCSIPYSCNRYIPSRITQDITDLPNPFVPIDHSVPATQTHTGIVYKPPDVNNSIDTTLILLIILLLILASLIK